MQPVPVTPETIFKLDDRFIEDYRDREVPWGFGDLSYITFKRTYARKLTRSILFPDRPEETEETESWVQCCRRVIEGMITVQKTHCLRQGTPWDEQKARRTARDAYDRLFHFKWTPPGRGLWMMGTDFVFERSGAALNSCGFVSTKDIDQDFGHPFGWAFEMAMLGVGVGFDTRGKDTVEIQQPEIGDDRHVIGDSREGWREALERLLNAFVGVGTLPREWDYSEIRPQGAPIESFGGTASGPGPLREAIEDLTEMYHSYVGQPVDSRLIVDTFNITGRCVVAGGVRRSAQIALGDPDDQQFLELKQDNEKVRDYRWVSNNSPIVEVGQDYSGPAEATAVNGEPGYFWLDNARKYGRMKDGPDHGDMDALGVNPCVTGDTLVATTQGLQKIEDLIDREDFRVYEDLRHTEDQTRTIVGDQDGVVCRGEKEIVEIELDSGHRLKCTPDHEIVTTDGKVEARHLSEAHEVLLSRADAAGGDQGVNVDWAEVMGFLVADGCLYQEDEKSAYEARLSFYHDKKDMAVPYLEKVKRCRRESSRSRDYGLSIHDVKGTDELRIGTKLIDVPSELKEDKLQVPKAVMHGSFDVRAAFVRGLFSGDGCVQGTRQKGRSIRLSSISKRLLRQVQTLLSSLGVKSVLYWDRSPAGKRMMPDGKGGKKAYDCETGHELAITRESMQRYMDNVGFSENSPQIQKFDKMKAQNKRSWYRDDLTSEVKSVKPLGKEEVYDVLNTTTSTFIANGIVVSNCGEQPLEDHELCTLVETFPAHHDDYESFRRTLKMAYLYGKTVSLVATHSPKTNEVMLQNRRIGLSQSGIVQSINCHGYRTHFNWCDRGYEYVQQLDRVYSDWLAVPRSIRTTSVKPSGTVSLLAGATAGCHWDHSPQYIRRMEINKGKKPLELCEEAGYPVEQSVYKDESMVVEFPIQVDDLQRGKADVPVREKADLAAQMQYFWSDNAVSCTAEFDPETTGPDEIRRILEAYEHRLKGISFLPQSDHGYDQAPYEPIDEEEYEKRRSEIEPIARDRTIESDQVDEFCSGEACEVDL